MADTQPSRAFDKIDYLTVSALAILAYALAIGIHEQVGHALACLALGGKLVGLSAYNYSCSYEGISDLFVRLSVCAGPAATAIAGGISLFSLGRVRRLPAHVKFLLWIFGTISLMTASAHLIYSGLTGMGDFGVSRDGLLFLAEPAWAWRIALTLAGALSYFYAFRYCLAKMDQIIGGSGPDRAWRAQRLAAVSYVNEIILAILIGAFTPEGFVVFLFSSAATSVAGTFSLLWMMRLLDRQVNSYTERLIITQNWGWIAFGFTSAILYALLFGPSIHF